MAEFNVQLMIQAVDRATKPLRQIGQTAQRVAGRAGLGRVADAGRQVGQATGNLARNLGMVGAAASGAVFAVERFTTGVANIGEQAQQSANRLGVSVEWLTTWQGVASKFGVQADAIQDGFKEMSMRADEFVTTASGGPAAEAFERLLGENARETIRKTKGDTQELFKVIMTELRQVENAAKRQRLVDEIFGGAGGEQMAEMVTATAKELERLKGEVRAAGLVITDDMAESMRAYSRQHTRLQQNLLGLRIAIGSKLMPMFQPLIKNITQWVQANRELIATRVKGFVTDVAEALPRLLESAREVGAVFGWIGRTIWPVIDFFGGMKGLAIGLSAILGGKLLLSAIGVASALGKLGWAVGGVLVKAIAAAVPAISSLGSVLLATPVGWFLGAVAAIAGAVYAIYDNWDRIGAYFQDKWNTVKSAFDQNWRQGIVAFLREFNPVALISDAIYGLIEWLTGVDLKSVVANWESQLVGGIRSMVGQIRSAFGELKDQLVTIMEGIWAVIQRRVESVALGLKATFLGAIGEIVSRVNGLVQRLPEFVRDNLGLSSIGDFAQRIERARRATEQRRDELRQSAQEQSASPSSSQLGPRRDGQAQRGKLDVNLRIDQDGRVRVGELREEGDDVGDVNVDSGLVMVGQ